MNNAVLLIDDDDDALISLSRALSSQLSDVAVHAATNATKALQLFEQYKPQAVVLDLCLDTAVGIESGISLLTKLLAKDATARVLILTGHSDTANGIRCLEMGAASFLAKPADVSHLKALLENAIRQCTLHRELERTRRDSTSLLMEPLVGSSAVIEEVRAQIRFHAQTNQSVLITGETGTGKGLCAKLIHSLSKRNNNTFVRYQPNFTSPEMVNSDLFGHQKGAFTGAEKERRGLLLEADKGTLFLDEVDEFPLQSQVALLGVFQEKAFRPLGSNKEIASDFRLLTACNKPIQKSVEEGSVRTDFYHRIAHDTITLPPLRNRLEDIPELANHFLVLTASSEDIPVLKCSTEAISILEHRAWSGNIREFQATIESATFKAHFNGRTSIEAEDLATTRKAQDSKEQLLLAEQVREFKKKLATRTLNEHDGNQVQAAIALGINRSTLKRILTD